MSATEPVRLQFLPEIEQHKRMMWRPVIKRNMLKGTDAPEDSLDEFLTKQTREALQSLAGTMHRWVEFRYSTNDFDTIAELNPPTADFCFWYITDEKGKLLYRFKD